MTMRVCLVAVAAVIFAGCAVPVPPSPAPTAWSDDIYSPRRGYEIRTTADEFEGSKTIRMGNDVGAGRGEYLEAVVLEEKSGRKSLWLAFSYSGPEWVFIASGDSLDFLLDGRDRITLSGRGSGSKASNRDVGYGGSVYEFASWHVAPQQFKQIANSRSVKMRVRGDKSSPVYELSQQTLENFRRFYEEQVFPVVPHL
jgi:hypothetical protein